MTIPGLSNDKLGKGALLVMLALVLAVLGSVAWGAYGFGQRSAGHDAGFEAERRRELEAQVAILEKSNRQLESKVAELEMSRRLDRDAYGQIERTLGSLQSQLAREHDDLAFYRSIVSPADGVSGLRIQRFDVLPGPKPREVKLKLTLVQAMRHESMAAGLTQITISGMQGDVPARYTVGELLGRPKAQLPFSFRYFQTIEQDVTLPEGFQAFEAYVQVRPSKVSAPIQQAFAWKVGAAAAL